MFLAGSAALILASGVNAQDGCLPFEYQCEQSGECIMSQNTCDGVTHCDDGTDEMGCTNLPSPECTADWLCHDDEFEICSEFVCDGEDDCDDGSDELYCDHLKKDDDGCNADQFTCGDGQCKPADFVCDGDPDCADGSDEAKDLCRECYAHEYECSNGYECVDANSELCNGIPDCSDGSDEGDFCDERQDCYLDSQFMCDSRDCMTSTDYVCDGGPDCEDGSDEPDYCREIKKEDAVWAWPQKSGLLSGASLIGSKMIEEKLLKEGANYRGEGDVILIDFTEAINLHSVDMPIKEERGYDNTCITLREDSGRRIYKQCTNTTGHIQEDTRWDFFDTISFRRPSQDRVWQGVKSVEISVPNDGLIDHIRFYGSGGIEKPVNECPEGRSLFIDAHGEPDETQDKICFPTKESAFVKSCNNEDLGAEMHIQLRKDLFINKPSGFEESEDGQFYEKTYAHGSTTKEMSEDKMFLDLTVEVKLEGVGGWGAHEVDVYTGVGVCMEFTCRYSMEDQMVSEDTKVRGYDTMATRIKEGEFEYELKIKDDTMTIGEMVEFTITPKTLGFLHAQARDCRVTTVDRDDADKTLTAVILKDNGNSYCRNKHVHFTMMSGQGGKDVMSYQYTAFKWSTDVNVKNEEKQTLTCTVRLSLDEFGNTNNPNNC